MSFDEMLQQVQRARNGAARANQTAIDRVGRAAVSELRGRFPRDTGEAAKGFRYRRGLLSNDVPHTPFAHDGLVFRLAPQVLDALEAQWAVDVERELADIAGW